MEKTLFKEYEEWCVKENKDPLNEGTLREFQQFKAKEERAKIANSKAEKKEELVKKQEEIFKSICEYVGVKTTYKNEWMFDVLDNLFKSVVLASVTCNNEFKTNEIIDRVLGGE